MHDTDTAAASGTQIDMQVLQSARPVVIEGVLETGRAPTRLWLSSMHLSERTGN
jgi:hypothetical protein